MNKGDRVSTPDGPGTIVGPWRSRGLKRYGRLTETAWIVDLDEGRGQWRRIYSPAQLRVIYAEKTA